MWPLKTLAFFVFFWAGCCASLFNPIWGLLTYIFVYQTDPTDTWWGLPLVDVGMRFSFIAALSTMLGLVLGQKYLPRGKPTISTWEWGVVLLFVFGALNTVLGIGFSAVARTEFEKFWKVLLFTLILCRLASERRNFTMILWALVVGSLYLGYDAHYAPSWAFVLGRLESVGGPDFSTTSGAAAHMSAMLPLIGAMFLVAKRWPLKLLAVASGVLTVNTIIMCRTRSAFIGIMFGMATAFLVAPRIRRYRIHALLLIGCVGAFTLADDGFWDRMETLTDQQAMDTDLATVSRKEIWVASRDIISDYPLGVGVGNFTRIIGDYDPRHYKRSSHNSLIVSFTELGIQGGVLFLTLAAMSLWYLKRAARLAPLSDNPHDTQMFAYGLLISMVTYFITALGTQRFYCESFWWVFALPISLYRAVRAEIEVSASMDVDVIQSEEGESQDEPVVVVREAYDP